MIRVKYINQDKYFRLIDIVSYLYVLMYENVGIEDTIIDSTSKVLTIKGFNFDADLVALEEWIIDHDFTMEELGVDGFVIPETNIMSYEQLMDIFVRNKKIYDHVVKQLVVADNIRIYNAYKKIYDSLLVTRLNTTMFTTPDGEFAGTYTRFLESRDPVLYQHINYIRSLSGADKTNVITSAIGETLFSLDNYIDTSDFTFLFTNIPSLSSELLKGYVYKIINFFKSYKTELMSINIIYRFNDKLDNRILIIDNAAITSVSTKDTEQIGLHFADQIFKNNTTTKYTDKVTLYDTLFISYY
jgi:hypothetical protein